MPLEGGPPDVAYPRVLQALYSLLSLSSLNFVSALCPLKERLRDRHDDLLVTMLPSGLDFVEPADLLRIPAVGVHLGVLVDLLGGGLMLWLPRWACSDRLRERLRNRAPAGK